MISELLLFYRFGWLSLRRPIINTWDMDPKSECFPWGVFLKELNSYLRRKIEGLKKSKVNTERFGRQSQLGSIPEPAFYQFWGKNLSVTGGVLNILRYPKNCLCFLVPICISLGLHKFWGNCKLRTYAIIPSNFPIYFGLKSLKTLKSRKNGLKKDHFQDLSLNLWTIFIGIKDINMLFHFISLF